MNLPGRNPRRVGWHPNPPGGERGSVQVLLLLAVMAATATAVAGVLAARAAARQDRVDDLVRTRVRQAAAAVRAYHAEHQRLPRRLDDLTRGGYLEPAASTDPHRRGAPLRYRLQGGVRRGTASVYSVGRDRLDGRGAGDDVVDVAVAAALGGVPTRERAGRLVRAFAVRATATRGRDDLVAANRTRLAALEAERLRLAGDTAAADWPVRVVDWLAAAGSAVRDAAADGGRGTAAHDSVVDALRVEAAAVRVRSQGFGARRSALTAAAARRLRASAALRRFGFCAAWIADEVWRGVVAAPAGWRDRVAARLAGCEDRSVEAMLDGQDGDSGYRPYLASQRNIVRALRGAGLDPALRSDGWGGDFRIAHGRDESLWSAGPDGVYGSADDRYYPAR